MISAFVRRAGPRRALGGLAAAFLPMLVVPAARAQDLPPGTPPDVAAILRKMKGGAVPTPAELKRLQEWGQQLSSRAGGQAGTQFGKPGPTQAKLPQGIPCEVRATIDYTGKSATATETGHATAWTKAMLFPNVGGNGDYMKDVLNTSVPVSSFKFEPYAPGGKVADTGGGSYTASYVTSHDSLRTNARLKRAMAGLLLTSTGGASLYVQGAINGEAVGTAVYRDDSGSSSSDVDDDVTRGIHVGFPCAQEVHDIGGHKAGQPTPTPAMKIPYQAMVAAVRSAGSSTISASEAFDFVDGGTRYTGHGTLTIVLRPSATELRIEPADEAAYEKWLPLPDVKEGGGDAQLFGDPKPFTVHLAMVDTSKAPAAGAKGKAGGPTTPNAAKGGKIDVYLRDVSTHKGTCMNYPQNGAEGKKGLFFVKEQPAGIEYVDETHVRTVSQTAVEATVKVAARDTGAWGNVQAECAALGLQSKNVRAGTDALALPIDDDGNHLPDYWEKQEQTQGHGPDWDDEDKPKEMKPKGDGLSLFDEYRGFLVEKSDGSETFQRLSPKATEGKRKLFVFLTGADKELYRAGATLYGQAAGVSVFCLHAAARMKDFGDVPYPNWINFNETPYSKDPMRAVWIAGRDSDDPYKPLGPGVTGAVKVEEVSDINPIYPDTVTKILISRKACAECIQGWAGWLPPARNLTEVNDTWKAAAAKNGMDLSAVCSGLPERIAALTNDLIAFVAMHELGHATGARHHKVDQYAQFTDIGAILPTYAGAQEYDEQQAAAFAGGDHACPMRYWHFDKDRSEVLLFLSGKWNLTTAPTGGPWKFCPDESKMAIKESGSK